MAHDHGSQTGRMTAFIAIIVVTSAALAISFGYITLHNPESDTTPTTQPEYPTITLPNSTVIHNPISINGDTEFNSMALLNEWQGDGTPSSPYIIQGLDITSPDICVDIVSVVETHAIIRNCRFHTTAEWAGIGINLWETSNIHIQTCIFDTCEWGVNFFKSQNCGISDCIIQGAGFGINVSFSESVHVQNVYVYNNTAGMLVDNSVEVVIRDNLVFYNEYSIDLWYTSNSTLENNTVISNQNGILIAGLGSNITVLENTVTDNSGNGLELGEYSSYVHVVGNRFGWNNDQNGVDNGTNNMWDDGVSMGNAWSDYSGDGGYVIFGSAESIDHFPSLYKR
jgi:parallel beta-helix repeat protein